MFTSTRRRNIYEDFPLRMRKLEMGTNEFRFKPLFVVRSDPWKGKHKGSGLLCVLDHCAPSPFTTFRYRAFSSAFLSFLLLSSFAGYSTSEYFVFARMSNAQLRQTWIWRIV